MGGAAPLGRTFLEGGCRKCSGTLLHLLLSGCPPSGLAFTTEAESRIGTGPCPLSVVEECQTICRAAHPVV